MKMKHKIPIETKPGIKRKLEKVDVKNITTKAPLKADLVLKIKHLQDSYNDLEKENTKNLEIIETLKQKIKSMEKRSMAVPKETQTDNNQELKCSECNFEASNVSELNWHMGKVHGWPLSQSSDDLDYSAGPIDCKRCDYQAEDGYDLDGHKWSEHEEDEDGSILCKICDETFANVGILMKHKKLKHREKVAICLNYNANGCPYEDRKCWFLHIKSNEEFKCNICDENFQTKSKFMKHRKNHHTEMVKFCKNNEECVFKSSCWFRHEIHDEHMIQEKSEKNENGMAKKSDEKYQN